MQPWLAWTLYTRQCSCLCLQNAWVVRICYHTPLRLQLLSARGAGSGAAGPTPRGFRSGRNQRAPGGAGGPDTRGGRRRRRLWTRAGPFPWIASAAAGVAAAPGEPGGCRRGSPPRGASLHPPIASPEVRGGGGRASRACGGNLRVGVPPPGPPPGPRFSARRLASAGA